MTKQDLTEFLSFIGLVSGAIATVISIVAIFGYIITKSFLFTFGLIPLQNFSENFYKDAVLIFVNDTITFYGAHPIWIVLLLLFFIVFVWKDETAILKSDKFHYKLYFSLGFIEIILFYSCYFIFSESRKLPVAIEAIFYYLYIPSLLYLLVGFYKRIFFSKKGSQEEAAKPQEEAAKPQEEAAKPQEEAAKPQEAQNSRYVMLRNKTYIAMENSVNEFQTLIMILLLLIIPYFYGRYLFNIQIFKVNSINEPSRQIQSNILKEQVETALNAKKQEGNIDKIVTEILAGRNMDDRFIEELNKSKELYFICRNSDGVFLLDCQNNKPARLITLNAESAKKFDFELKGTTTLRDIY